MMMYEGLCFAQWSMTLMSNAPFGCLASLHFSAFALMCDDWNIKRWGGGCKRREERGWRINMASRFLRKRIKESNLQNICVCSLGQWLCLCTLQYILLYHPWESVSVSTELFWFTAICLSHAKPAMLSPDLGVTKQSPYPLLWEHEVKGTAVYDRHLLTSRPLSLLIHMNHHHRLHVTDKDTLLLKYITHRIYPLGRQPLHKVLYKEKKKESDCLWYLQVQCTCSPSSLSDC